MSVEPIFFRTPAELRRWLRKNHASASELEIGFYKKSAGERGITYQEALDEALCFGWIDGVRHGIDATRYTTRFTPRKSKSFWSLVNIKRMNELIAARRAQPAGIQAFERRDEDSSKRYSYERETAALDDESERTFRADRDSWEFFRSQAPSYQRAAAWWVVAGKRPETRRRRLEALIAHSAARRRLPQLTSPARRDRG